MQSVLNHGLEKSGTLSSREVGHGKDAPAAKNVEHPRISAVQLIEFGKVKFELMRRPIKDEFTDLPVSRQRKYQLRMQRDSRCTECGQPAARGSRCLRHLVKARERQRMKRGLKRRYYNTISYKLESMAA